MSQPQTSYSTRKSAALNHNDVWKAAVRYVGTPYRHQGRLPTLDCIGLFLKVCHDLNLFQYDYLAYPRDPGPGKHLLGELSKRYTQSKAILSGSLVTFMIDKEIRHCGIVYYDTCDGWLMCHAYQNAKKTKVHEFIPWWRKKATNCFMLPNVDYSKAEKLWLLRHI